MTARETARESELYLFWLASSEARAAMRGDSVVNELRIDEARDEIEVMAEYTDWPALRSRCLNTATSLQPLRRIGT